MQHDIRKVRPEERGTAVDGFAVFQDVAYGATAPIAGLFADQFGFSVVFLLGLVAALSGLLIATNTLMQKTTAVQEDGIESAKVAE